MNYGNIKDSSRTKASHKVLRDKAFNVDKNLKYDRYLRNPATKVNKFLDEMSAATHNWTGVKSEKQ